jgi:fatty acid synthase subunit alpha, fungi type
VPKAFKFSCTVAGQIPTGWDAGQYGIPTDIITQTDCAMLLALVCTAEGPNQSGITDPYELYEHMHPSDMGTSLGSGIDGSESLAKMFKDRREVLQET